MQQLLTLFRNFTEGQSLDNMIALSAFGKGLQAEYETHGVDVPSWISDTLKRLTYEIGVRTRDELERKLVAAKARYSTLLSRDEKKAQAAQEIADLEKQLNPGQQVAPPAPTPSA